MYTPTRLFALLALPLAGCIAAEAPQNPFGADLTNGISGTIVVDGIENPGNVIITVFDANNPGPPAGTGRPVTVSAVPFTDFTGYEEDGDEDTDAPAPGLQSAEYYVGGLADGDYLVNALVDMDGDFNLFASILAGATCGDIVGTHLQDVASGQSAVVRVEGGELKDNITIVAGREITTERPVFTIPEPPTFAETSIQETYKIVSTNLHSTFPNYDPENRPDFPNGYPIDLPGPCDPDPNDPRLCDLSTLDPCDTMFWVWAVDSDGDGIIDPHPDPRLAALGAKDVWPRVFLSYLGQPQEDGTFVFEEGFDPALTYGSASLVYATQAAVPALWPSNWPIGTPFPMRELELTWVPATSVVDANGQDVDFIDARELDVDPSQFPSGAWGMNMISFTGQTWILPNEAPLLPPTPPEGVSFDPLEQAGYVTTVDSL